MDAAGRVFSICAHETEFASIQKSLIRSTMIRVQPLLVLLILVSVSFGAALILGQERDRARIEDKYKWNLADIYPNVAAWRQQKEKLATEIPTMKSFVGKLGSSAKVLADALDTMTRLDKELSRLYVYS